MLHEQCQCIVVGGRGVGVGLAKFIFIKTSFTLTKAVDMGHTWSKYGNGMGQPMTNVWVLYGLYMRH